MSNRRTDSEEEVLGIGCSTRKTKLKQVPLPERQSIFRYELTGKKHRLFIERRTTSGSPYNKQKKKKIIGIIFFFIIFLVWILRNNGIPIEDLLLTIFQLFF